MGGGGYSQSQEEGPLSLQRIFTLLLFFLLFLVSLAPAEIFLPKPYPPHPLPQSGSIPNLWEPTGTEFVVPVQKCKGKKTLIQASICATKIADKFDMLFFFIFAVE